MPDRISFGEIFFAFLKLGLTSFGGPVAHIGYFRDEFIIRRRWLGENTYADIVALCQFLPGPASSQVGMTIGLIRGGLKGGFAAWLGFTTPSAITLIVFAYGITAFNSWNLTGLLAGLKIVAVAVVAQAVWGMATKLCPDRKRVTLALLSTMGFLIWPLPIIQIVLIIIGGITGWAILRDTETSPSRQTLPVAGYKNLSVKCLLLFASLLISLPIISVIFPHQALVLFDSFYRSGSLVFGGGHVVLPMLQSEVVPTGWITKDQFLAGYGAAQAVPGPLFTFAAYLATVMTSQGWLGGLWCLFALYTPSFLLILGVIPYWEKLRQQPVAQAALKGINAVVVGLLLAALYNPVWISAIGDTHDFILCLAAFGLLVFWKCPAWLVVLFSAATGYVFLGTLWGGPEPAVVAICTGSNLLAGLTISSIAIGLSGFFGRSMTAYLVTGVVLFGWCIVIPIFGGLTLSLIPGNSSLLESMVQYFAFYHHPLYPLIAFIEGYTPVLNIYLFYKLGFCYAVWLIIALCGFAIAVAGLKREVY